jgi:hypothetical protein
MKISFRGFSRKRPRRSRPNPRRDLTRPIGSPGFVRQAPALPALARVSVHCQDCQVSSVKCELSTVNCELGHPFLFNAIRPVKCKLIFSGCSYPFCAINQPARPGGLRTGPANFSQAVEKGVPFVHVLPQAGAWPLSIRIPRRIHAQPPFTRSRSSPSSCRIYNRCVICSMAASGLAMPAVQNRDQRV